MTYLLSHQPKDAGDWIELATIDSILIHIGFQVASTDGKLTISSGFAAFHSTHARHPKEMLPMDHACRRYQVAGGSGIGSFTLDNALPRRISQSGRINESSCLYLVEFDPRSQPATWFADDQLASAFTHPTLQGRDGQQMDLSRYSFYQLGITPHDSKGESNRLDRWAYSVDAFHNSGIDALAVTLPFLKSSVCGTILKSASQTRHEARYMPRLDLKVRYGHYQQDKVDRHWSHFEAQPPTALPSPVTGYVMVAQGAFRSIRPNDLDDWHLRPEDLDPSRIARRLEDQVAAYSGRVRDLETVGDHEFFTDTKIRLASPPTEVLYLEGLQSSKPVF